MGRGRWPVAIATRVHNYHRTVGAMLSGRVAERYGHAGLPEDSIHIKARGTGGQSFGAWVSKGVTIELEGEANDYVGKGLSGGRLIIYPPKDCAIERAEDNIIVGNTVLYGAISGECALFHKVAAAWPVSASVCATPVPPPWWKGSATTAANT